MSEISTNQGTVTIITSKFTSSLSNLTFSPSKTFSYSQSAATAGVTDSLSSLASIVSNFESYASSDVKKLTSIHQAIEKAEKASVGK